MLSIAEYRHVDDEDGSEMPVCHTLANTFWSTLFFLSSIVLFFIIPVIILLTLYLIISKNLISNAANLVLNKHIDSYSVRARKQVILMLGTVVLSFFLCLLPFRAFTVWIIFVPDESVQRLGAEMYYNILYFSRILIYLNSAINPILYNLMSSKFRTGFLLCSGKKRFYFKRSRNGTISTTATSYRSSKGSHDNYRVYYRSRNSSIFIKNCSESPDSNRSSDSHSKILKISPIGKINFRKRSQNYESTNELNVNLTNNDSHFELEEIPIRNKNYDQVKLGDGSQLDDPIKILGTASSNSSNDTLDHYNSNLQRLIDDNVPKCCNATVEVIILHEKFINQSNINDQESFV